MWHAIVIKDHGNRSFNSKSQFNIKAAHIKRMSKVKKVGGRYGFYVELFYIGRERDRVVKNNQRIFIYPFITFGEAYSEYLELRSMRKITMSARKAQLNKRKKDNVSKS